MLAVRFRQQGLGKYDAASGVVCWHDLFLHSVPAPAPRVICLRRSKSGRPACKPNRPVFVAIVRLPVVSSAARHIRTEATAASTVDTLDVRRWRRIFFPAKERDAKTERETNGKSTRLSGPRAGRVCSRSGESPGRKVGPGAEHLRCQDAGGLGRPRPQPSFIPGIFSCRRPPPTGVATITGRETARRVLDSRYA